MFKSTKNRFESFPQRSSSWFPSLVSIAEQKTLLPFLTCWVSTLLTQNTLIPVNQKNYNNQHATAAES